MLKIVKKVSNQKKLLNLELNILLVGASGVGKSSTINALFDSVNIISPNIIKIGHGVKPETKYSSSYEMNKLKIWDTPGFGDTTIQDDNFRKEINTILKLKDEYNNALIDLIIVIIDGSSKDINTSINIINNVIMPNLVEKDKNRVLIGINKIDLIKSGKYWDFKENKPKKELETYLEDLKNNIKKRIFDLSGINIEPIIYSSGNKLLDIKPYNLLYLIDFILKNINYKKREIVVDNINEIKENWENNENQEDIKKSLKMILKDVLRACIITGISSLFGGLFFLE